MTRDERAALGRVRATLPTPGDRGNGAAMDGDALTRYVAAATETLGDFFAERRDWFSVCVVQAKDGGFDVVLRIDGTYASFADAERLAHEFAERLSKVQR